MTKVRELWEEYRERVPGPGVSLSYDKIDKQSKGKELDDYDEIAQKLAQFGRPASQDEYEDYCHREPYDPGKSTALQWWRQDAQRKRWPRLSVMALDILSIPAMSSEPERVFSGGRRTVTWDRTQMTAETLEMTERLKHWKQSGILKKLVES